MGWDNPKRSPMEDGCIGTGWPVILIKPWERFYIDRYGRV